MFLYMMILFAVVRTSYQVTYSCNSSNLCGCSLNSVLETRIVGGAAAGNTTWAWAVSISVAGSYLCGGSILSSSWIITAAHCVKGYTASQVTIYAGSNSRWTGTQTRVVSKIIIHSDFNYTAFTNDIALLQLDSPLTMDDPNVSPICIPSVDSETLMEGEWPPVGTDVIAVGWGRLSEGGYAATTLQQVTLQTIGYQSSTCSPLISDWQIQLCAGVPSGSKDTCQGDSGGPLMLFTSTNQWVLIGLTSNGIGCARPAYSGLYTRVAAYYDWISLNTNNSFYTLTNLTNSSNNPLNNAISTRIFTSINHLFFFSLTLFLIIF